MAQCHFVSMDERFRIVLVFINDCKVIRQSAFGALVVVGQPHQRVSAVDAERVSSKPHGLAGGVNGGAGWKRDQYECDFPELERLKNHTQQIPNAKEHPAGERNCHHDDREYRGQEIDHSPAHESRSPQEGKYHGTFCPAVARDTGDASTCGDGRSCNGFSSAIISQYCLHGMQLPAGLNADIARFPSGRSVGSECSRSDKASIHCSPRAIRTANWSVSGDLAWVPGHSLHPGSQYIPHCSPLPRPSGR